LGVGVNTLWLALKNGWWKPNVRFVSLPSTLPTAITNPNFRSQTPTAQFCGNGALGLCRNSNLCGGGNTYYNSCDMSGLSEEQAIPLLGGFVFLFTNCTTAPTATPTPPPVKPKCGEACPNNVCETGSVCTRIEAKGNYCTKSDLGNTGACQSNPNYQNCCVIPTIVPACLSAKLMVKSGTNWVNYNPQTHKIKVGDTVRLSVTGQSTTLTTAKFRLEQDGSNNPSIVNSSTRTVSGNNVTFTADYVITSPVEHKVIAEVYQ
jgi:hypothetical protein